MRKSGFIIFLAVLIFALSGCYPKTEPHPINKADLTKQQIVETKALYLMPLIGGQLTREDLGEHPEVVVVNDFDELKKLAAPKKVAIWIDKDCINLVDKNWLNSGNPQRLYPQVLVGYNNALYSCREMFNKSIHGPYVDWSKKELEPGFSVWMIKVETSNSTSAFMKDYNKSPVVGDILEITNSLLAAKYLKI